MIYTDEFKMELKVIVKKNKIKNRAILEILENVAAYHSDNVNFGANEIGETKQAWILLDWKLEVLNRPTYGQTLTVNTWGRGMKKFFTRRDYEVYDENENLCAIATSKWSLIDIEKEKIERLTPEIINKYEPEEKSVFPDEKLGKLEVPTDFENCIDYKVIRKDIDINKHMHNLYYLDLAYEAMPEEVYNQRPFDHVRITYKKEIKLGDELCCKYTKQNEKHIIVIENKNTNVLHSIIEIY